MQTIYQLLSSFAFLQMCMCCLLLSPYLFKKSPEGSSKEVINLFILLICSSAFYILPDVFQLYKNSPVIWWSSYVGGNILPGVFWLVALTIFSEHIVLKPRHYIIASLTLVIPLTSLLFQWVFSYELTPVMSLGVLIKYGSMAFELALISHALLIAIKYWRDDLVEQRRYIRGVVISFSAFYIFVVIVVEQLFKWQWQGLDTIKSLLLFVLITAINLVLFKLRSNSLFVVDKKNSVQEEVVNKPVAKKSKELTAILDAMNNDLLYQQEGVTIASFAKHLAIHEYKLRKLINGELNYRNFNDFLNFYRIKEVTNKLTEENFAQTPILTLALESGFRSLSSFNKAFKETHQLTPSQYRKKYLP